ncbi:MAG TPA: hypothetical protein VI391_06375 [Thermoanaerobaculia bacterium]
MDKQMWLALLEGGLFAGSLIALGFYLMHVEKREHQREKKNGRI